MLQLYWGCISCIGFPHSWRNCHIIPDLTLFRIINFTFRNKMHVSNSMDDFYVHGVLNVATIAVNGFMIRFYLVQVQ